MVAELTEEEKAKLAETPIWIAKEGEVWRTDGFRLETFEGESVAIALTVELGSGVDLFVAAGASASQGARSPWQFEVGPAGQLVITGDRGGAPAVIKVYAPGHWVEVEPSIEIRKVR